MRKIKIKPNTIILEPFGRNTAPAITLAAIKAMEKGEDPIMLVLPSDHLIKNLDEFNRVLDSSIKYCNLGKLVAFGIIPNKPETGYGYIQSEKVLDENIITGEKIIRFIEKPNEDRAKKFLQDKRFTWNSGIFLFKASIFIKELKNLNPEIYNLCKKSLSTDLYDLDFQRLEKKFFSLCPNISIDNAIMEKTKLGIVLPLNVGWSDIGSWQSMWDVSEKDNAGNVISGKVITKNVSNTYLRSNERLVVGIGLENLVVVESSDAILIAKRSDSQKVKDIVEYLGEIEEETAIKHKKIFRPWGNYSSLADGPNWQVKKILVNPGHSLSLQLHNHRTEHWIVVDGTAIVEINGTEKTLNKNESIYIPLGSKHRLSNRTKKNLVLIEVQSGNYLGEDDIVRFKDNYGRI